MGMSLKQIRYLYAIGVFKGKAPSLGSNTKKSALANKARSVKGNRGVSQTERKTDVNTARGYSESTPRTTYLTARDGSEVKGPHPFFVYEVKKAERGRLTRDQLAVAEHDAMKDTRVGMTTEQKLSILRQQYDKTPKSQKKGFPTFLDKEFKKRFPDPNDPNGDLQKARARADTNSMKAENEPESKIEPPKVPEVKKKTVNTPKPKEILEDWDAMAEHVDKEWDSLEDGVSKSDKEAQVISMYTGGTKISLKSGEQEAYQAVNNLLRGTGKTSQEDRQTLENFSRDLDQTMKPAPKDLVTYRGVLGKFAEQDFTPGTVFTDEGYGSSTLNPEHAYNFSSTDTSQASRIFRVSVPKGHQIQLGMQSDMMDGYGEHEVLLSRGTSYRVLPRTGDHYSEMEILDLEVIPSPSRKRTTKKK